MTEKALISELTWRSLEMQKTAFPDMHHYIAPDETPELLRASSRKDQLHVYVLSIDCIADRENDFRDFIKQMKTRKAVLHSKEENLAIAGATLSVEHMVKAWKAARKAAFQKIGGKISAKLREEESKEAIDKICDRWPMPSKTWRTPVLLREADITYNTAVKYLGPRPIAQYNYQAKLKRKKLKEDRANA